MRVLELFAGYGSQALALENLGIEFTSDISEIDIIRAVKPKYLLMENVKNLVGKKHIHNFTKWLKTLEMMGYWNFWQVLNAKDYGVPQNRERVFVVSILGGGQYLFPNKIKLEKRLKDILEPNVDEKYYLSDKTIENFISRINLSENTCIGGMQANQSVKTDGVCTCLTSSMGTGGGYVPMVTEPLALDEQNGYVRQDGCVGTLTTDGSSPKHNNRVIEPIVMQVGNIVETDSFGGNPQRGRVYSANGCSPALNTMQGGGLEPKIVEKYRIRKLTTRECWRLMGVKDEQYNKLHDISNSQLYKMAGNSIVVDVLMGIFKNLFLSNEETKGQLQLF